MYVYMSMCVGMYGHVYMCLLTFGRKIKNFQKIKNIKKNSKKSINSKKFKKFKNQFLDPQHIIFSLNFNL
jgi:hypothetical protein